MKTSALLWTWIIVALVLAATITIFLGTTSWRTFLMVLAIVLVVTFMLRHFSPLKPNPQFVVFGIMTDIGIVILISLQYLFGFAPPSFFAIATVLIWLALSAITGMLWPFSDDNVCIRKFRSFRRQHNQDRRA